MTLHLVQVPNHHSSHAHPTPNGSGLGIVVAGSLASIALVLISGWMVGGLLLGPAAVLATDIVHAIPLAVVAGLGYLFAGMVAWNMLASLLVGSILAVQLGSRLAGNISSRTVQLALALVLLAAGVKIVV